MGATLSGTEIQQIKEVFREVLNEKMSWNTQEKLSNIEKNLEEYLKIPRPSLKKWYSAAMTDKVDYKRIQAIVESAIDMKVRQIVDEEITEQITPLRNDIDKVLKIVSDDRQEIPAIEAKVDKLEERIVILESDLLPA